MGSSIPTLWVEYIPFISYSNSFTQLFVGFIVGALYFIAIGLVAVLENVFDWK